MPCWLLSNLGRYTEPLSLLGGSRGNKAGTGEEQLLPGDWKSPCVESRHLDTYDILQFPGGDEYSAKDDGGTE